MLHINLDLYRQEQLDITNDSKGSYLKQIHSRRLSREVYSRVEKAETENELLNLKEELSGIEKAIDEKLDSTK